MSTPKKIVKKTAPKKSGKPASKALPKKKPAVEIAVAGKTVTGVTKPKQASKKKAPAPAAAPEVVREPRPLPPSLLARQAKFPRAQMERAEVIAPMTGKKVSIVRPADPTSKTGRVWAHCDRISEEQGRPAHRKEVIDAGLADADAVPFNTSAVIYAKWRMFHSLTKKTSPGRAPTVSA